MDDPHVTRPPGLIAVTRLSNQSVPARYGIAVAAVGVAYLLTWLTWPVMDRIPLALFFAAIMVGAWYGGLGPGLLATVLAGALGEYYFIPPYESISISLEGALRTAMLGFAALIINSFGATRRRSEIKARASEQRLLTTLQSIGDGVIATDAGGRVTLMNPVAESLTGWRAGEARGKPLTEVFRIINEQTRLPVESPVEKALRVGRIVGLANHTILLARDGREIPIDDSGAPIRDDAGEVVGVVLVFHDIVERKKAENELRQRERELTDFVDNATIGLHWVGADGTILWANRAELEMLGYERGEYVGHNIAEFHADSEVINDILQRLTNKETLHDYEARLRSKDGSIKHALINSNVMWDGDEFVHTRCFTRDVTLSRQSQESLRHSEERLSLALHSAKMGTWEWDVQTGVVAWSDTIAPLHGLATDEFPGTFEGFLQLIHEEDREHVTRAIARAIDHGASYDIEFRIVWPDGSIHWIGGTGKVLRDADGKAARMAGTALDITTRKLSEATLERLAAIVESSDDAIIGKTLDGIITNWNTGAEKIYGYTADEVIGHPISIIVPPEHADEVPQILERLRSGGSVDHLETVRIRKDGTRINVAITISPIKDSTGRVVGASTIARDITGRKQSEAERAGLLAREQATRAEAERAVDRIVRLQIVTSALAETRTSSQVAEVVVSHGLNALDAHAGSVALLNEEASEFELIGARGYPPELLHEWRRFPVSMSVPIADAVRNREPVFIGSIEEWQERYPESNAARAVNGNRAIAAIPLIVKGRALGAMGLSFEGAHAFTPDDREFMQALAGQCAQALDRTRLYEAESRARAAAEASEQEYRFLAESIPQIVWTARPDGWLDYYNRRWYDYTGMTPEQTAGWGWQPVLHPDDTEACLRAWSTAVKTGHDYEIEYRFRRASDGVYRWHLGRAAALRDAEGNIIKWFGTGTDIDDRKRAEEASRFLAEASEMLASSLDYQTTLTNVARLAVPHIADWCSIDMLNEDGSIHRTTTHFDPLKEALARSLDKQYPANPDVPYGAHHVMRTGSPELAEITDEVLQVAAHDEEHLRVLREMKFKSYICVPLVARGERLGAITFASAESGRLYTHADLVVAEDLAHRAALAVENARLFHETQEANRAKDIFLATLSHELRTPLTPIIGWVHMMRAGKLRVGDVEQGLSVIDKNSQSLTRLINDLLDMSSILSGKMRIVRVAVELDAVIREAAETVRAEADKRGVGIDLTVLPCDDGQPMTVLGDRTRLVQVFWNLLNNAVKFSDGGSHVRVTCQADGTTARVEVLDAGRGIEPEFLPHVFERFRQADGSSTRLYGGLGIGLALVKSFVEAHGGAVYAASDGEGRGSSFSVTLPLYRAMPEALNAPVAAAPPEARESVANVRRVLIVEDARDTLDMLRIVFETQGFEAKVCESAAEALRIAASVCFDVVVSDIGLPQIDGYELIKRLREMPHLRGVPAVALTGYASPKDAEAALAAGFDVHLPKPIDPVKLATVIGPLLLQPSRVPEVVESDAQNANEEARG